MNFVDVPLITLFLFIACPPYIIDIVVMDDDEKESTIWKYYLALIFL